MFPRSRPLKSDLELGDSWAPVGPFGSEYSSVPQSAASSPNYGMPARSLIHRCCSAASVRLPVCGSGSSSATDADLVGADAFRAPEAKARELLGWMPNYPELDRQSARSRRRTIRGTVQTSAWPKWNRRARLTELREQEGSWESERDRDRDGSAVDCTKMGNPSLTGRKGWGGPGKVALPSGKCDESAAWKVT